MKEFLAFIVPTIIGSLITLITLHTNNKAQQKRERDKFERDKYFQKEQNRKEQNEKRLNVIVEIIALLNYLKYAVSQTSSLIDLEKNLSVNEHNNNYKKDWEKICRLESLIVLYAPNCYEQILVIEGNYSVYWGKQKTLLHVKDTLGTTEYTNILNEVIKISRTTEENISNLVYELRTIVKEIQNN